MDAMDEESAGYPKADKQEAHGGPIIDRVGQMHCGLEEHVETALVTLAHCERQKQSVAMYDEIVAAPEASPFADKQAMHAGPPAAKVGHKHAAFEQSETAVDTSAH